MRRNPKRLQQDLERAGAAVAMPDDLPEDLAQLFLEEVLSCPDCMREIAQARIPPSRKEH